MKKTDRGNLCKERSDCTYNYLNNNTLYRGCVMGGQNTGPLAIGVINSSSEPYEFVSCLTAGVWTQTTPCSLVPEIQFYTYPLKRLEQYVVLCNTAYNLLLFPCEEQSQIQIPDFLDNLTYSRLFEGNATVLFTTQKIVCNSFCIQSKPKFVLIQQNSQGDASDIDPTSPNILRLYYRAITPVSGKIDLHDVSYSCQNPNVEAWKIRFAVANTYTAIYMSQYDVKGILTRYDAGIELTCLFSGSLVLNDLRIVFESKVSDVKAFIYISYLDPTNNEVFVTSPYSEKSVLIPENLSSTTTYDAHCYLGEIEKKNVTIDKERYYKEFPKFTFNILAVYKTSLMYDDGRRISSSDIEDLSDLKCNTSHYNTFFPEQAISLKIGMLTTQNFSFPYSDMINQPDIIKNTSTINLLYFERSKTLLMAIYCIVNGAYTTPFPVVSGDRPFTTFYNIFPNYEHKYSLRTFVYGCVGQFMVQTNIVCNNCTSTDRLVETPNGSNPFITIPSSIRTNMVLDVICNGKAEKYSVKSAHMVLSIIAFDYNDFNNTLTFLMEGDEFNCVTKFITDPKSIEEEEFPMPTQLNIDDTITTTSATEKMLILKRGGTKYQGCCLQYSLRGLTCDGNWKDILVATSYKTFWTKKLTEIYPNNELKCYACLNFTSVSTVSCLDEHRVNAYVGIYVIRPDKTVEKVDCSEKKYTIKAPAQLLKPDNKSYYKMSEFIVELRCCIRFKVYASSIQMKSCNEFPPPIRIIPSDKLLFTVGESFSCTTDMVDCIQGLIYIVMITPEKGEPMVFRSASVEFTSKNVGNRVEIKCVAGVDVQQSDTRIVRVEESPYDIVITGVLPVLWYGQFLQCSAKGFPPPDIYWIQTNGSSSLRVSDYFLLIGPWDFSGNYTVICEAKNTRGSASKTASFYVYNSRIRFYESSAIFYVIIPILTLLFIGLIFGSMLLTFQEVFFGVPLFSPYAARGMTMDTSVKSKKLVKK